MPAPPSTNPRSFRMSTCIGTLVRIPSTMISSSAVLMRAMADSRVSPKAMSFAMSES